MAHQFDRPADLGNIPVQRACSCPHVVLHDDLDNSSLGTIWGPLGREMGAQRVSRVGDRLGVRVEIALRRYQRAMPGDLAQNMQGHASVSTIHVSPV